MIQEQKGCSIGYQMRDEVIMGLVREMAVACEKNTGRRCRDADGRVSDGKDATGAEGLPGWERRRKLLKQKKIQLLDSYFAGRITVAEMERMREEYAKPEPALGLMAEYAGQWETVNKNIALTDRLEVIMAYPGKRVEIKLRQRPVCSVSLPDYREYTAKQREVGGITDENTVIGVVQRC